jgi:two-component system cell cycle response regulator
MTANISDMSRMTSLSPELRFDLVERVHSTKGLSFLLELLGQEIEKLGLVDGYLINLRDAEAENLISVKVHFTPEFHFLDETYYRYKVPLDEDSVNVSAKAFLSRGIVVCDAVTGTEKEKQLLNLWKLNEIAGVAILDDDDFGQQPIGTLLLLKQQGHIADHVFTIIEQMISIFYKSLRNALEYSFLKEQRERFQAATEEHSRFLKFLVDMNNLTEADKIYEIFLAEIFRHYKFDGAGIFLLENGALVNKKVIPAAPRFADICAECEQYLADRPYQLDTTDGGVSHTFLRNMPLMFHDVQTILHIPMSEKDSETISILKSTRTLLMEPINYQHKPIGVLTFYSLADLVDLSPADLTFIDNLASFFGTAITNSKHFNARA